jgi:fucose 4-O-acetylase-like acetyltransferase
VEDMILENKAYPKKREQWLDVLKGLAAIFVIITHLYKDQTWFYVISGPIMLPLFFVITGYTFNRDRNTKDFLCVCIWERLVVPLFCLSLAPLHVVKEIIVDRSLAGAWTYIVSLLSGKVLWYVYCSIFAMLIFYGIHRVSVLCGEKWATQVRFLLCIAAATVGFVCVYFDVLDVCRLNTACIVQIYLLMGYYLKEKNLFTYSWLMKKPWIIISVSSGIYIGLVVFTMVVFPGEYFDLNRNMYYSLPVVFGMIVTGNFALIQIAKRCKTIGILAYIGRNSLVYYSMHSLCFFAAKVLFDILNVRIEVKALEWWVMFLVTATGCAICAELITRFAPFTTGRGYKKQ